MTVTEGVQTHRGERGKDSNAETVNSEAHIGTLGSSKGQVI